MLTVLPSRAGATDWPQFNFDGQHTGNNPLETTIQTGNVSTLHVRYHVTLPSVADGAPAFLQGVSTGQGIKDLLFLNTKDGRILALDAATGTTIWSHRPATGPHYTTSSPAVDPNRQFVYAYALDGRVHKYNVGDGTEAVGVGWPELATFKPTVEKGSSALSLVTTGGGAKFLYVSNGGYPGDAGDYQGHVTAINLATGAQNVFNTDCSNLSCHLAENGSGDCSQPQPDCSHVQSAVWARAGVVYSSDLDLIFFATGNGDYDANTGGRDWGDSVLAIHPDGTGSGAGLPVDSYTPTEFQILQNDDADLGSTSPAILPGVPGSNIAHLGVQSQKQPFMSPYTTAKIRLLNLSNLSGSGAPGHVGGEIQKIDVPQGGEVLTAPAVWVNPPDGSVWVFYANGNGISGLKIMVDGVGNPSIATQWTDGTGGTSPIVANGILYYASFSGMLALDPTTGSQLWGGTIGGIHWESPIVVNGRLYVTDENAQLWAFEPNSSPAISINDVTVVEGTSGVTNAVFTVTLSGPSSLTTTVGYQTADGTAASGIDYGIIIGSLTFPPGTTTQTITVPVIGDRIYEPDETFFVNLSSPVNATITRGQGVGTIHDNSPPGLSINDVTVAEGNTAVFTVTLSPANPTQTVTVQHATANGTAAAGNDFVAASGTLTFPVGTTTQTINVVTMTDVFVTGIETFFVNLSSPVNAPIAFAQGTGTIVEGGGGGDFNGDGKPDVLWRRQVSGDNLAWFMNGTTIAGGALLTAVADPNWFIVGTADFNGDGKPDILWRNQATGDNLVWFMNGTTLAGGAVLTPITDTNWRIVATGDFNGDGKPDIVWRNQATGDNLVWFMSGTTIAGGAVLNAIADTNWTIVGAADFNGDGKPDILWRNQATGHNLVWFMNGTTLAGGAVLTSVSDLNWTVGGIGDFNGDGKSDILWRNQATGDNLVWFMNGTTISGGAVLTRVADTNWRIVGPR